MPGRAILSENRMECLVCGIAARLRCSKRRVARYCSAQHQRKHWSLHKSQCISAPTVQGAAVLAPEDCSIAGLAVCETDIGLAVCETDIGLAVCETDIHLLMLRHLSTFILVQLLATDSSLRRAVRLHLGQICERRFQLEPLGCLLWAADSDGPDILTTLNDRCHESNVPARLVLQWLDLGRVLPLLRSDALMARHEFHRYSIARAWFHAHPAAEDASSVFDVVRLSCLVPCQLSTVKRELEELQIATAATTSSQQPGQYRFGLTAQWHPPMGDVFGMEPANSWTSEPLRVAGASFRLQLLPVIGERFPTISLMRCQVCEPVTRSLAFGEAHLGLLENAHMEACGECKQATTKDARYAVQLQWQLFLRQGNGELSLVLWDDDQALWCVCMCRLRVSSLVLQACG